MPNRRDLFKAAVKDYPALARRCAAFDAELMADAERIGGPRYAYLCALAYRQALAAYGLAADSNGAPIMFRRRTAPTAASPPSTSIFPMIPEFLLFFPSLAKATLVPPPTTAPRRHGPIPYAPHDLGTYPLANGQVYGMRRVRRRPHAGRGKRQPDPDDGGDRAGGWQRRFRLAVVAAAHALGGLPGEVRLRSRESALHRRFHGPPGAQRQPVGEGDPGHRGVRRAVPDARRQARPARRLPDTWRKAIARNG